ncbi:RagB/SusD family nutrient uptake outer membrane protein [Flavivirga rizhaonensis]|nr:RagB/SusD family nutrient uptake outer membrane protein [Flavivirga rizhaonensis]
MKYIKTTNLYINTKFMCKVLPIILLVLFCQSCEKDFLDQTNPNALTTKSFWQNNGDLNAGLISVYSVLKDNDVLGIQSESIRTDIAAPGNFRNNGQIIPMYHLGFDLSTPYVEDKWSALYLGVFRANQVIENYEPISATYINEASREEGLRILAQARALRGYFYFMLNNSFNNGSVPILKSIPKTFAEFQQAFSTSQKVKEFYREDLKFGLENLPKTYSEWLDEGKSNLGRITAGACEALLGKSYLYENDFSNAEIHFKNVIDNYNYKLVDDMAKCFTGIDEFNSESIFELNFTTALNLEANGEEKLSQDITHMVYNGTIQPSSHLVMKYQADKLDENDPANMNLGANVYDSQGEIIGTEDRLRTYSLRMGNCMGQVDDPDSPMYGETCGEFGNFSNVAPFARNRITLFKKYLHWNTIGGGAGEDRGSELNNKSDINIMVLRLADIYLSYAECMLVKGDLSEALRYINRVRKRSHLVLLGKASDPGAEFNNLQTTYVDDIDFDISNGDQEVNTENLMTHLRFTEIPLELCLEGDRNADLRRWGIYKEYLQELASVKYDYWHYPKNGNGKHGDRYKCFITFSGDSPTTYTGTGSFSEPPEIQDKFTAANEFDPNFHNYLPIPQLEITTNLNWDVIAD